MDTQSQVLQSQVLQNQWGQNQQLNQRPQLLILVRRNSQQVQAKKSLRILSRSRLPIRMKQKFDQTSLINRLNEDCFPL